MERIASRKRLFSRQCRRSRAGVVMDRSACIACAHARHSSSGLLALAFTLWFIASSFAVLGLLQIFQRRHRCVKCCLSCNVAQRKRPRLSPWAGGEARDKRGCRHSGTDIWRKRNSRSGTTCTTALVSATAGMGVEEYRVTSRVGRGLEKPFPHAGGAEGLITARSGPWDGSPLLVCGCWRPDEWLPGGSGVPM